MQSVKVKIIIVSKLLNPYLAFHFDIFNFQSAIYNCWLQNLTQISRGCLMKEASAVRAPALTERRSSVDDNIHKEQGLTAIL